MSHAHLLGLAGLIFAMLMVSLVAGLVAVAQASSECSATHGTFSLEDGTAWCRY